MSVKKSLPLKGGFFTSPFSSPTFCDAMSADRCQPAATHAAKPSTAGKPDERGLTPQMREMMARRAAQQ